MTMTIELAPEQEALLTVQAQERGMPVGDYARTLLQEVLQSHRNEAAIAALDAFLEEDEAEQAETWRELQQGLNENSHCL